MPPVCPNGHGMGTTRGSVGMAGTLTYRHMVATVPRLCTWYIRHVDVFRRLTPRDADELARAMAPRRYDAGQLIVSTDTQLDVVYLTRTGTVRLFYSEANGRETTVDHL